MLFVGFLPQIGASVVALPSKALNIAPQIFGAVVIQLPCIHDAPNPSICR